MVSVGGQALFLDRPDVHVLGVRVREEFVPGGWLESGLWLFQVRWLHAVPASAPLRQLVRGLGHEKPSLLLCERLYHKKELSSGRVEPHLRFQQMHWVSGVQHVMDPPVDPAAELTDATNWVHCS